MMEEGMNLINSSIKKKPRDIDSSRMVIMQPNHNIMNSS